MPFENATKILYDKYERIVDRIDLHETELENLEDKVEEARKEVVKAKAVLDAKLDRLKKEAEELRSAMNMLSGSSREQV